MIKADGKDYPRYAELFGEYTHSIPVIFSTLENQYAGELYVDAIDEPNYALLLTQFAFHFVAGNPKTQNVGNEIHKTLFEEVLQTTGQKEAILFCPNQSWHCVLDEVFKKHNGLKDVRKIFHLNIEKFNDVKKNLSHMGDASVVICHEQECGSQIQYPVAKVLLNGEYVSYCSAFMIGNGQAELDVSTDARHQNRGYAALASIALIAELLKRGLTPNWCTWPYREASQALAKKLGFEEQPDVLAYIWTEADCGELQI